MSIGPTKNPFALLVIAYAIRRLPLVVRGVSAGLEQVPRVIEAFDISNIVGTYAVAGMVCSADGAAQRNRYRRR